MQPMPKNLKYGQDGTGRDTYIYTNNGGYYPSIKEPIMLKDPGNFNRVISQRGMPASLMDRPKKYNNNGTGRDSYIYCDDGGYCPGQNKTNFLRTLRSTTMPKIRPYSFNSMKGRLTTSQIHKSQLEESGRLSQPKNRTLCHVQNPQDMSSNYDFRQTTKWLKTIDHHRASGNTFNRKLRNKSVHL